MSTTRPTARKNAVAGLWAVALVSTPAIAQWRALRLLPAGSIDSEVWAVDPTHAYGQATNGFVDSPTIFALPAGEADFLGGAGATGAINGVSADQLVGSVNGHAAFWSGALHTESELSVPGYSSPGSTSTAQAISGDWLAGVAATATSPGRAVVWHGSTAGVVIHPPDAYESAALAADGQYQGGWVRLYRSGGLPGPTHAVVWSGTAQSMIDLNGNHEGSAIYGMSHGQLVGGVDSDAALWPSVSSPFISLNPPGVTAATLYATCGTAQVGQAVTTDGGVAAIWFGTADSFMPLNRLLPGNYIASGATSICESDGLFYVGGWAINAITDREEGFVWIGVPEPAAPLFVCSILLVWRRRRQVGPRNWHAAPRPWHRDRLGDRSFPQRAHLYASGRV